MISSNDFRPGVSIELDGAVWRVVEFLHVKPGKGSAFVRTKLKNVQTGSVVERTFRAGETVPQAVLEKSTIQHTYKDGEDYVFMDMETYEENRLTVAQIGDRVKYLKEGMEVNVVRWNNQVMEVELPNSVVLEVTQTDPGVKGDTATGGTKPAIVETGAQVMVPLFISIGERIKVDTRTDSYLGRE
ncbi:elongation factor P [Egbenema bharatensis]|uniref:elongation factor P n=1 Tax=Egbenema bharatensis TaxID=3463334 RepID=UPI003A884D26